VPLAHHLRADEHVDRAVVPALEDAVLRAGALRHVAIEPGHADARVGAAQRGLDTLGADAVRFGGRALAALAAVRPAAVGLSAMARARAVGRLPRERHAAMRAVERGPAGRALEIRREAATIEEHERLLAARRGLCQGIAELVGE